LSYAGVTDGRLLLCQHLLERHGSLMQRCGLAGAGHCMAETAWRDPGHGEACSSWKVIRWSTSQQARQAQRT
jgi:hypothetical protein